MTNKKAPELPWELIDGQRVKEVNPKTRVVTIEKVKDMWAVIPEAEARELWEIREVFQNKSRLEQAMYLGGTHFFNQLEKFKKAVGSSLYFWEVLKNKTKEADTLRIALDQEKELRALLAEKEGKE